MATHAKPASPGGTSADRAPRRRAKGGSRPWVKVVKNLFAIGLVALLTVGISGIAYMFQMRKEADRMLGSLDERMRFDAAKTSVILAKDGKVLYEATPERREPITLKQVPPLVQQAILAAEDRRFYSHGAVDYWSMGRVLLATARDRRASQGGSTLTMQLAKLLYSDQERTLKRKIQDIALAEEIEKRLTKDQILTLYLNTAYFGAGATGISAASQTYFGKPVAKLNAAEAAILARCVRRPSDQNPVRDYNRALENGRVVLSIMRDEGWLTPSEYQKAYAERPKVVKQDDSRESAILRAPYFVASVLGELRSKGIDIRSGGYTVYTTLDSQLQERTEQAVRDIVRDYHDKGVTSAAFILMDGDGKILSEVGGTNYRKNKFNIVTQSGLQPGSSFKPFVYATALSQGKINAESQIDNTPISIGKGRNVWRPKNSSRTDWGSSVPLRTAVAYSINLPAIHTILQVGPKSVVDTAVRSFGFRNTPTKPIPAVPSLALGACLVTPMEMAEAYSVFPNRGTRVRPYSIDRVIGPDGDVVMGSGGARFENVLDPEVARIIDDLLLGVVQRGTGKEAQKVESARGKTGTTNEAKDAWFCGYAQNLVGIGWVGNQQLVKGKMKRLPMKDGVFGGTITVRMWTSVMTLATSKYGTPPAPQEPDAPRRSRRRSEEPIISTEDRTPSAPPTTRTIDEDVTPPIRTKPDPTPENPPPSEPPRKETPPDEPIRTEKPAAPESGRSKTSRSKPTSEGTVEVEICADSGALATPYCPETVTRTFSKSRRPKGRCPVHRGTG